jgi:predicted lipoprotein with Yx(FWY)xxD motif
MNKTGANQPGTVVHTAHSSTLGTVLVDGHGMTLYTLTNNDAAVTCTGNTTPEPAAGSHGY